MIDDIIAALLEADRSNLPTIRQYIRWVAFRRRMNNHFYFRAHWIDIKKAPPKLEKPKALFDRHAGNAHWI